jgi:hypothetical protein
MALIAETDVVVKVGQTLRLPFFYEGVTGLGNTDFTIKISKDGVGNQAATGCTVTEVDASNNPGDYLLTISVSGLANVVGIYRLLITADGDTTKKWIFTIRVTTNGTNEGSWGQTEFTATTNDGRVTDGTTALQGATVRVLDASNRIVVQTQSDASGLWGPVYLDDGSYTVQAALAGYTIAVGDLTIASGIPTGPGIDLACIAASTTSTLTAGDLFSYARRAYKDKTGSKADVEIIQAVNEAMAMVARAPCDWQRLNSFGRINLKAQYTTGTITVVDGDATVVLAGGTWPSWAASGSILINNQWHEIATRTSNSDIELVAPLDMTGAAGLPYTLVQYRYDLPVDLLRIEEVFLGTTWPWGTEPVSSIILESNRHTWLNVATASGVWQWSCTNDQFAIWPCETQDRMVNFRYRRLPAELVNDSDVVDWDRNQIDLLRRAIDYAVSLRGECVAGDTEKCYQQYQLALTDAAVNEKSQENRPLWRRGGAMTLPAGFQGTVS